MADNLLILRRWDPEIEEVLFTTGHVCIYHMSTESGEWIRRNVEGSLFLYKRRTSPRFQMKVLNKLTTSDYVESIHSAMDFEVQSPYLLYTYGVSEIHSIWFYEVDDLTKFAALLERIKTGLPKPDILPDIARDQAASTAQPGETAAPLKSDDDSFYDKTPTKAPPNKALISQQVPPPQAPLLPQAPAQPPPPTAPLNNLTMLLHQATMKHQQQQVHHAAAPPAAPPAPPPTTSPLLAPSFFHGTEERRGGDAPQPSAPQPAALKENPLHRFFPNGGAATQQPSPPAAPELRKNMSLDGNATLAKLFGKQGPTGAAAAAPPPPPPAPTPQPQPPAAMPTAMPATIPLRPMSQEVVREKLRDAFGRLLANDVFVDMMAAQFRASGLMNN